MQFEAWFLLRFVYIKYSDILEKSSPIKIFSLRVFELKKLRNFEKVAILLQSYTAYETGNLLT